MRISLIGPVPPYRGGIAHFTTLLAKKLMAASHDVQVISFKKQYPAWLYPGESDKDESPGREQVDAEYLLSPLNPISWRETVRAIVAFKPEQVILPWWITFWGPAFHHIKNQLKRLGIPTTILIHNTLPHEARPWDRILAKRTLKGADRYIVMTEKERTRLLALLPNAKEIYIIPHPLYRLFTANQLSKKESRSRLGLPENKPIVLFFGFIRPYKGLADLIEAINIIRSQGMACHLLVAGEFWDKRATYDQQIKRLALEDYIHIFDKYIPDNEVSDYFNAADLFVAPYSEGTQSGVLKAALGFGLPAVVTDIIADSMVKNMPDRCEIVPPGDPEALAKGIIKKSSTPKLNPLQVDTLFDQSWRALVELLCNMPHQPEEIKQRQS